MYNEVLILIIFAFFLDETVNITVLKVTEDKTLKIHENERVWDCGGTRVDDCFKDILKASIVTSDVLEQFRLRHTGEYFEFFPDFEMKKDNKQNTTNSSCNKNARNTSSVLRGIEKQAVKGSNARI